MEMACQIVSLLTDTGSKRYLESYDQVFASRSRQGDHDSDRIRADPTDVDEVKYSSTVW